MRDIAIRRAVTMSLPVAEQPCVVVPLDVVDAILLDQADELIDEKVAALLADGLTIDEAVEVALLNNLGFHAACFEVGASRADVVHSGLLSNPSLSLAVRFPEGGGRSTLTAGFAQQIVDLWQIPVRKQVAEAELEQIILAAGDHAVRRLVPL